MYKYVCFHLHEVIRTLEKQCCKSLELWKKCCHFVLEGFPGRKVTVGEEKTGWPSESDGLTENRIDRQCLRLTDSLYLMPCSLAELKSLLLLNDSLRWHLHESQNLLAGFCDGQSSMMCLPCIFAWLFTLACILS